MDNKITKDRVSVHLEYDWLKYLAIIVAAIFLWSLIFTMTRPRLKAFEEIKILSFNYAEGDLFDKSPVFYPNSTERTLLVGTRTDGFFGPSGEFGEIQKYFIEKTADAESPVVKGASWESLRPADPNESMVISTRLMADNYDFLICAAESFAPDEPETAGWRGAIIDFDNEWFDADFSFDNFGRDAGFASDDEYDAAKFYTAGQNGKEFRGFILNKLKGIDALFPIEYEPGDPDEEAKSATYVISVLYSGGNIGSLNKYQKKYDAHKYNEAYDALKFIVSRYNRLVT